MTTLNHKDGSLQMAAALAFHLPGTRLEVSGDNGVQCLVGPLTDPRCMLHPAEFRDLIVTNTNEGNRLFEQGGASFGASPTLSLTTSMDGVRHLGSGLYEISAEGVTSYAFATLLPAARVDDVISDMQTEIPLDYDLDLPQAALTGNEQIAVSLIYDEGLGVTLVVMCCINTDKDLGEHIAHTAVSACVVAEMEQSVRSDRSEQ